MKLPLWFGKSGNKTDLSHCEAEQRTRLSRSTYNFSRRPQRGRFRCY